MVIYGFVFIFALSFLFLHYPNVCWCISVLVRPCVSQTQMEVIYQRLEKLFDEEKGGKKTDKIVAKRTRRRSLDTRTAHALVHRSLFSLQFL